MKKFRLLLISSITVLFFGIASSTFISCEGQMGPAGMDGEDASAGCISCHNDETNVLARQLQAANSVHSTGGNFERSDYDCAPCHTNEGFVEVMATGETNAAADISNPTPQTCRTCHLIHNVFDSTDFALRTTAAVTPRVGDEDIDIGKGNLCANCHQTNVFISGLTLTSTDSVTIFSKYQGPHHGPQSNIFAGIGGFEFTGSMAYTNSTHTSMITDACITCHMAEPYGAQAGGHTFKTSYEYHNSDQLLTAGCIACHTDEDALETKIEDTEDDIEALLTEVKNLLVAEGVLDGDDHAVPGKMHPDAARSITNYLMVLEDRSMGVHNFNYAKALLTNTKETLMAL